MERSKDPMIVFRTTIRGKNSKGGDRLQLYIGGHAEKGNADLEALIAVLTEQLGNPKGAKLDIHTTKKESGDGRTFDSSFAFVKAVSDGAAGRAGPTKFVPKGTSAATQASAAASIAGLKAKQVG